MTPSKNDDLKKVMESGEFITIGQNILHSKENIIISEDFRANKNFLKYNLPIGIDFSKSINPLVFLTSLEILDKTIQIPKISDNTRYLLENLRTLLRIGNIWLYKEKLKDEIDKIREKKENQYQVLMNVLGFLIKDIHSISTNWISLDQLIEYIDSDDQKNIIHKWVAANIGVFPNGISFSTLISKTIFDRLLKTLPEDEDLSDWIKIQDFIISAQFSKAYKYLSLKITRSPEVPEISNISDISDISDISKISSTFPSQSKIASENKKTINDEFVYEVIEMLWILLNA